MEKKLPNHSKDINIGLLVEINDNSEKISKRPKTVIGENLLNVLKQKENRGFQQSIDNIPTKTILSPCSDNLVNYDIMNNPEFSDDVLIPDTPKSKCADLSSDSLSLEDEVFFGPVSFVEKCAAVGAGRISHEAPIDSPTPMSPESSKLFSEAQHMISILENRKTEKNNTKVNQPGSFPSNSLLKTAIANKRRLMKNESSPSKSIQPVADLLGSEPNDASNHHVDVNIPQTLLLNCQSITSHSKDKKPCSDSLNSDECLIQTKLNEGKLLSHQTKNVLFDNKDSDILIDIDDASKNSEEVDLPVSLTGTSEFDDDHVKMNLDTCCTNSVNPVLNVANNNKDSSTKLHANQDLCERTDSLHLDLPVSLTSVYTNSSLEVLPDENSTAACNIKTEPEESISLDISNHTPKNQANQIPKSQASQILDARIDQIIDSEANQVPENQPNQISDSQAKQISNPQAGQIPDNQANKIFDTQANQIDDNQANIDSNKDILSKSDSNNVDQNPLNTKTSISMNKHNLLSSSKKSQPSNSVLNKSTSTFKRFSKSPTVLKKSTNEILSAKNNNLIKTPSNVSNKTPGQSGAIQKLSNGDKSKISHTPKQNLGHGLLNKQSESGSNPILKQQTMKKDQLKTPGSTSKNINYSLKGSHNSTKASSIKPSSIKSENLPTVKNLTTAGKLNSLCPPCVPTSQPRSSLPSASNPTKNPSFKKPETINSHSIKQKQSLLPQRNLSNLSVLSQKKTDNKSSIVKPVRAIQPVVKTSSYTSKLNKDQNSGPNNSDQPSPSSDVFTSKDSFEKGKINTTPVKISRNVQPKRILSDCSTPIKSSQQTPLKRKSFLPTPKKSTSSSTSRSSCSNAGSLSSIDSPLTFRSSRDVLSRIDNIDDSSPSCMKSKQTRVQHTPLNKENVSVLNKVRSVWSPVHKANLLSAEEQAIMCTKRTSVYYRK